MTVTGNELELIEHLDFQEALPCEDLRGCDREATWKVTRICCRYVVLCCDMHRVLWIEKTNRLMKTHNITCDFCGAVAKSPDFVIYTRLEG